jgi:hypothetical protein
LGCTTPQPALGPLSGAAKYPAGARPSKCIIIIISLFSLKSLHHLFEGKPMTTTLVLGDTVFPVSTRALIASCDLFLNNLSLAMSPYQVHSSVPPSLFAIFVAAIEGKNTELTTENSPELSRLCDEFGFLALSERIAAFLRSPESRISILEERLARQEEINASLQRRVDELTAQVRELSAAVALDRSPPVSMIISEWPSIFEEFDRSRFNLLWRGSRDGFGAKIFHEKCDGSLHTVTLILTIDGWIFGGYTPLSWGRDDEGEEDSEEDLMSECAKNDASLKSFIFTIANPHDVGPRRFLLNPDRCQCAISSHPEWGPTFGAGDDLYVCDECNCQRFSYTGGFGDVYQNDTGLESKTFFTGKGNFVVREIEVFQITM